MTLFILGTSEEDLEILALLILADALIDTFEQGFGSLMTKGDAQLSEFWHHGENSFPYLDELPDLDAMTTEEFEAYYKAIFDEPNQDQTELGEIEARPLFGKNQILSPDQIIPGMVIKAVDRTASKKVVVVKGQTDYKGYQAFWITPFDETKEYVDPIYIRHSLKDFGVLPYDEGYWNETNHLIDTGERLSEEVMQHILEKGHEASIIENLFYELSN